MVLSRVTIFSFLLAMMLGLGIWRWDMTHRDNCSAWLAGDTRAPSKVYVTSGTRTVVVPCNQWLPRQPEVIQILCLADLLLWVLFLVRAIGNAIDTVALRKLRRSQSGRLAG